jgi:peptidoglycan/xylan/chitin deacetylase (PgdA/CDA1 family)
MILYYHRVGDVDGDYIGMPDLTVSIGNFRNQLKFIKEEFDVVPLRQMIDGIENGKGFPNREIAITFDDGYYDNYRNAFPILKEFRIPATIFVTTGHIGGNDIFWWDKIAYLEKRDLLEELVTSIPRTIREGNTGRIPDLRGSGVDPVKVIHMMKLAGRRKREKIFSLMDRLAEGNFSTKKQRVFLSWDEIREMKNHGIDICSHTHTHPVLTELDSDELRDELLTSRNMICEVCGEQQIGFSYPDGWYDERVKKLVIESGYRYAVQTNRLPSNAGDRFSLKRRMVKEGMSKGVGGKSVKSMFIMEISGVFDTLLLRNFRKKSPYAPTEFR